MLCHLLSVYFKLTFNSRNPRRQQTWIFFLYSRWFKNSIVYATSIDKNSKFWMNSNTIEICESKITCSTSVPSFVDCLRKLVTLFFRFRPLWRTLAGEATVPVVIINGRRLFSLLYTNNSQFPKQSLSITNNRLP